jgi:hypothetical protein
MSADQPEAVSLEPASGSPTAGVLVERKSRAALVGVFLGAAEAVWLAGLVWLLLALLR